MTYRQIYTIEELYALISSATILLNAWIHMCCINTPGRNRSYNLAFNLCMCVCLNLCVCPLTFCRGWSCRLWWFLWANGAKDAGWDGSYGRAEGAPLCLQTGKGCPAGNSKEVWLQLSERGLVMMTVLWSVQQDLSFESAKSTWLLFLKKSNGRGETGYAYRRKGGGKTLILICVYEAWFLPSKFVSPVNSSHLVPH